MKAKRILVNGNTAIKKCKHGHFMYNVNDAFVGRSLDLYGEWCEDEIAILDQVVKPGDVVVDIGAYIGTHTVYFANKVTDGGFVYSLEPQRIPYNYLCGNLALNGLLNVKCLNMAAGDEMGTVKIPLVDQNKEQNFGAVRIDQYDKGDIIKMIPLDALKFQKCNLIKIDVEGMEVQVLKGAMQTIKFLRPILFVENNTEEGSKKIIKMLRKLDYKCWWHISPYFNPNNFFGNKKDVFDRFQPEVNLLCFPTKVKTTIEGLEPVSGINDDWVKAVDRINKRYKSKA